MNCPHHVAWILPVRNGLHQCFQCWEVVTRKDVTPKFEDLPADFQRRWEAHERAGQPAAAATSAPAAAPAAAKPAAPAKAPAGTATAPATAAAKPSTEAPAAKPSTQGEP